MRGLYNILLAVKGAIAVLDKKERRMLLVLWMLSLSSYAVSVAMPTIEMFIADGVIGYIEGTRASLYLKWGIIGIIICSILIFAVSIGGIIVKASDDSNKTRTYKYYTTISVEDNDTLWTLADRYNNGNEDTTSYINNIMQMNDLSSDTIHSGKNLIIYYYSTETR